MTKAELIKRLTKLPDNTEIRVQTAKGFEPIFSAFYDEGLNTIWLTSDEFSVVGRKLK